MGQAVSAVQVESLGRTSSNLKVCLESRHQASQPQEEQGASVPAERWRRSLACSLDYRRILCCRASGREVMEVPVPGEEICLIFPEVVGWAPGGEEREVSQVVLEGASPHLCHPKWPVLAKILEIRVQASAQVRHQNARPLPAASSALTRVQD